MPDDGAALLRVSVLFSPRSGAVDECALELAVDSTLADALLASGLQGRHPGVEFIALAVGIWGVAATLQSALRDADRIEFCRPLSRDPKETRRRRQAMQQNTQRRGKTNQAKRESL